jgi:hypothetical protein
MILRMTDSKIQLVFSSCVHSSILFNKEDVNVLDCVDWLLWRHRDGTRCGMERKISDENSRFVSSCVMNSTDRRVADRQTSFARAADAVHIL